MIEKYNKDWLDFRKKIELKAKGRCVINNKNWLKLRDFHFKRYIKAIEQPYFVLFKMIHFYKIHKEVPCAYRVYEKHKKKTEACYSVKERTRADVYRRYR